MIAPSGIQANPPAPTPAPEAPPSDGPSLRRQERLEISRTVTLIPILPDNSPDHQQITCGLSVDLTLLGAGLLVEQDYPLKLTRHIFGIEGDDGLNYYSSAVLRHSRIENGQMRIGAEFLFGANDLLRKGNIVPLLDTTTMRMQTGIASGVLKQWEDLGVLTKSIYDRVKVCPDCQSIPTLRDACRKCGSAWLDYQRLIHHYACAHVDREREFSGSSGLSCPKCRVDSLVVGVDYEYLTGPYICLDCNWSDTTREEYGCCLGCHKRFPSHQAIEQEVIGYSVERLDSLAFFNQH